MFQRFLAAALVGLIAAASPTAAQPPRDVESAARAVRQGDILPLNVIRQRVQIDGAAFIGADLIGSGVYRLRFMRGPNVMFVDVDARTGRMLRCMGC
jgi:hypothetical protein